MPNKKQPKKVERTRTEIIFALAQHAHPTWYHSLLNKPTEALRALLEYYEIAEREGDEPSEEDRIIINSITFDIDWNALHDAQEIAIARMNKHKAIGEILKNKQRFAK